MFWEYKIPALLLLRHMAVMMGIVINNTAMMEMEMLMLMTMITMIITIAVSLAPSQPSKYIDEHSRPTPLQPHRNQTHPCVGFPRF